MPAVTRVALETLGCKLNQAETERLLRDLINDGFCIVSPDDEFDVYILNSCSVTSIADSKARHLLRQAHRRSPQAALVLTGCFPEDIRIVFPGLKLVIPNSDKPLLVRRLREMGYMGGGSWPAGLRTRTFVKIQAGCSNFCAYCIVPLMRGTEQNMLPEDVLGEIKARVKEGYKEVVLTGTEIGSYYYDGTRLEGLIERILEKTEVARIRVSSLQPPEITQALLANWINPRVCEHFHLSLQSGSDTVLERMKRRYDTRGYETAVESIRRAVPDAAITTDIITGFPGETEYEYDESCHFCERIGFARLHVFSFSPRPGTTAARMPGQVTEKIKKERTRQMLSLARKSAEKFREMYQKKRTEVLWEQSKAGILNGYTGNYIRVYTREKGLLLNEISRVQLTRPYKDGLWAETPEI